MSEQITVGYNGADSSAEAVMWAANEAELRRLPLRIVSCYDMPALAGEATLGWGASEAVEAMRQAAEANITNIKATVAAAHPDMSFTTEVSIGPALARS